MLDTPIANTLLSHEQLMTSMLDTHIANTLLNHEKLTTHMLDTHVANTLLNHEKLTTCMLDTHIANASFSHEKLTTHMLDPHIANTLIRFFVLSPRRLWYSKQLWELTCTLLFWWLNIKRLAVLSGTSGPLSCWKLD